MFWRQSGVQVNLLTRLHPSCVSVSRSSLESTFYLHNSTFYRSSPAPVFRSSETYATIWSRAISPARVSNNDTTYNIQHTAKASAICIQKYGRKSMWHEMISEWKPLALADPPGPVRRACWLETLQHSQLGWARFIYFWDIVTLHNVWNNLRGRFLKIERPRSTGIRNKLLYNGERWAGDATLRRRATCPNTFALFTRPGRWRGGSPIRWKWRRRRRKTSACSRLCNARHSFDTGTCHHAGAGLFVPWALNRHPIARLRTHVKAWNIGSFHFPYFSSNIKRQNKN